MLDFSKPLPEPSTDTFKLLLRQLVQHPDHFTLDHLRYAVEHISTPGATTPAQIGSWLTALRMSGMDRKPENIASYAEIARNKALPIHLPHRESEWVLDIVGTGGDGHDTFNVSTAASFVVAGAGARVCKHGSKASTSKSGSADFLEELGIPIGALPPAAVPLDSRFLFLFAINFHPTFAITGPIRREMGFATIYNLLGPLINPARPDACVLGVYSPELGELFANTLNLLGMKRAWVVCGAEGLDEISPAGDTNVWELSEGQIRHFTVHPTKDFGLPVNPLSSLKSGTPAENAELYKKLIANELPSDDPVLNFVLLNAAALLYIGKKADSLKAAVDLARTSITSKEAKNVVDTFRSRVQAAVP